MIEVGILFMALGALAGAVGTTMIFLGGVLMASLGGVLLGIGFVLGSAQAR